ncbi:MAG: hypothetical protein QF554_11270 [Dehalococcoidia bacterium]|jgi:hypothetical protein|nr:hypothetical protein [Dehalococcoidia bacterium]
MPLKTISKTVTAAGTAERLSATDLLVWWARVKAKTANAGTVYLGDAAVSSSDPGLVADDAIELRGHPNLNLYDVFVDAGTSSEGVDVWYLEYA